MDKDMITYDSKEKAEEMIETINSNYSGSLEEDVNTLPLLKVKGENQKKFYCYSIKKQDPLKTTELNAEQFILVKHKFLDNIGIFEKKRFFNKISYYQIQENQKIIRVSLYDYDMKVAGRVKAVGYLVSENDEIILVCNKKIDIIDAAVKAICSAVVIGYALFEIFMFLFH